MLHRLGPRLRSPDSHPLHAGSPGTHVDRLLKSVCSAFKNSVVTADPLTLSLLCGCDGFNVAPDVSRCKQFLRYLVLPNTYCPTYIFRLQTNAACITIAQMNTPEKTIVGGIRLTPSYWTKFRQVWKARGRDWMLRWIDKEHSKLPKDGAS